MDYVLDNSPANKSAADDICYEKYNGFLPYSDNEYTYNSLKEYMKKHNIQKTWLGLKKKMFEAPLWVNSLAVGE